MFTRHKIAGVLMSFGLLGLAISTFATSPTASTTNDQTTVTIAISSGPQLKLVRDGDYLVSANPGRDNMVCGRVYRLAIADVGLSCQSAEKADTLASATY
jgi:hypothetical protein